MPPIRINSATELRAIGNNLSHTGDYQLACDIVLDPDWSPISHGDNIILDGDGHRVGPLVAPLFESLNDATVFELSLDLYVRDASDLTGGLTRSASRSTLQDVSLYGSVHGAGTVGALAGKLTDCAVERCQQYSAVNGCAGTGGLAGVAARTRFIDCRNMSSVRACSGSAGGVAGSLFEQALCQGCVNDGAVITQGARAGGIAGQAVSQGMGGASGDIILTDCRNQGEITSGADAGGIAGAAVGDGVHIDSCVNLAAVTSQSTYAGGICGRVDGRARLTGNKSCVKITAETCCAGGIAGGAEGPAVITGSVVDGAFVRAPYGAHRILGTPAPNRGSVALDNNRAASRVKLCGVFGDQGEPVSGTDAEAAPTGLNGESYDCPDGLVARDCFECAAPDIESGDVDWDNALKEMLRDLRV
ncbi:MAG: hypothetical protein LBB86_08325 [Oscillospiraceae bacterium]|jgi:hypothetical protein|nr:hypothetical protein [Oscillospiraceae bacterium]